MTAKAKVLTVKQERKLRDADRQKRRNSSYEYAKRNLSLHATLSRIESFGQTVSNMEAEIAEHKLALENLQSDLQDNNDVLAGMKQAAAEKA